eukprot:COSAG02_NODE_6056_length_3837_cov_5.531835_2_plen_46_part_00
MQPSRNHVMPRTHSSVSVVGIHTDAVGRASAAGLGEWNVATQSEM